MSVTDGNIKYVFCLFSLYIFSAMLPNTAHAVTTRHEVAALWSPLLGNLKTGSHTYTFYSIASGAALYRYAITPRFVLEAGYEAQSAGSTMLLHGPDVGVVYSFYGQPSFSYADEPLSLEVVYPFDAHFGIATWLREHDFSSFLADSASIFTTTESLANKGSILGVQAMLGVGFDFGSSLRLLMRARYLSGLTPAIENSGLEAFSVQCGLSAKL